MINIVEFIIYESQHHHIENFCNIFVLFYDWNVTLIMFNT